MKGKLKRGYITVSKERDLEINIIGRGILDGREVLVIGECKTQLSKNDINNFIKRKLERIKNAVEHEIFPLLVTHMTTQRDVEEYTKEKGFALYYSYDFV